MICYRCEKIINCPTFRSLYEVSKDFIINDCKDYDEASEYKYRHIAEHDDLMRLIYDYFTCQVDGDYSDEYIKEALKKAMWNL